MGPTHFKVRQGNQLFNRRGELVAGGGETIPADHPALKEHKDPAQVGGYLTIDPPAPADWDGDDDAVEANVAVTHAREGPDED